MGAKLSVIALLCIFTLLNVYSSDVMLRLRKFTTVRTDPVNPSRETLRHESFDSKHDAPLALGTIEDGAKAYLHLTLRLRAEDTRGYPNVFQTAAGNRGIRMEISGANAGIVFPDASQPSGVRGISLTTDVVARQWYFLEVEALSGGFIRARMYPEGTVPTGPGVNYQSGTLSFETSAIVVGGGFDDSRRFVGSLADISLTKSNYDLSTGTYRFDSHRATEAPILLGSISDPNNAYFRLKLRLRANSTQGFPNVFQTGPVNSGIRMEMSGSNAGILFPDASEPTKVRGITLASNLSPGKWYTLEIEARNGAFIHAQMYEQGHPEGHPPIGHASAALTFDTSDIRVGQGFDASRSFTGDLADISVTKGSLTYFDDKPRLIFYGLLLLVLALLGLALRWSLAGHPKILKLSGRLAFIVASLIPAIVYFEYRLSGMDVNYVTKRMLLEQQLSKIAVLTMGSSNAYYGIDPSVFNAPAYNLAFLGQSMYYDRQLIAKYLAKMPKLKLVILPVNYFTFGTNDADSSSGQSWRQFFYRHYFSIPTESISHRGLGFWFEPSNFSKLALYGETTWTYAQRDFLDLVDIVPTSAGWFDSGLIGGNGAEASGRKAASQHNDSVDIKNYDRNLAHFEKLVALLKTKHIEAALVQMPTYSTYRENLDSSRMKLIRAKLREFADRQQIKYVDYTEDARFSIEDFTEMVDHLNARGAKKFSEILNHDFVEGIAASR